jgi:hypothetical protein
MLTVVLFIFYQYLKNPAFFSIIFERKHFIKFDKCEEENWGNKTYDRGYKALEVAMSENGSYKSKPLRTSTVMEIGDHQ